MINFFLTQIDTNRRVKGKKKNIILQIFRHFPSLFLSYSFSFSVFLLLCKRIFSFSKYFPPFPYLFSSLPSKKHFTFPTLDHNLLLTLLPEALCGSFYEALSPASCPPWLFASWPCHSIGIEVLGIFSVSPHLTSFLLSSLALCLLAMPFNRFRGVGNIFSFPHMTSFFLSSLALCLLAMSFIRFQGVGNISSFPPSDLFLVVLLGSLLSSLVIQKVSSCWEYFQFPPPN